MQEDQGLGCGVRVLRVDVFSPALHLEGAEHGRYVLDEGILVGEDAVEDLVVSGDLDVFDLKGRQFRGFRELDPLLHLDIDPVQVVAVDDLLPDVSGEDGKAEEDRQVCEVDPEGVPLSDKGQLQGGGDQKAGTSFLFVRFESCHRRALSSA